MGMFNILFMCVLATVIASRVIGPEAIMLLLMPALALMFATFMLGEVVVNFYMNAETPHPIRDKRYLDAVRSVSRKARMLIRPRAWIVSIGGKPNAMAYGPGLPFMAAIGVSRELIDMLDQEELEAVLAHEFGHIRCRDTGILAIISLILGLINKLHGALKVRTALLLQNPLLFVLGWVVYLLGKIATYVSRFSVSQERELAADALSAYYMDTPEPLIRALTKLDASHARRDESERPMFEELMLAHPGLEERIASLRSLTTA
ncbi:MAG: M48 family metalloprotease [Patescibacteria group bacterium]